MQVPLSDEFDDGDLESVAVKFRADQLEWLREKAEAADLSLDRVVRSVIDARMRAAGDGQAAGNTATDDTPLEEVKADAAAEDRAGDQDDDQDNGESVVESLRSASKRLDELMASRSEDTGGGNPLARLRDRLGEEDDGGEAGEDASDDDADVIDVPLPEEFDVSDSDDVAPGAPPLGPSTTGDEDDDEDDDTRSMFDIAEE
jgi:hypothetical protein